MEKPCVMVVDDEKEIADLVEVCLENEGYRVVKYYSPLEALAGYGGILHHDEWLRSDHHAVRICAVSDLFLCRLDQDERFHANTRRQDDLELRYRFCLTDTFLEIYRFYLCLTFAKTQQSKIAA